MSNKTDFKEVWKPIKDYEDLYHISNLGRVKSFHKKNPAVMKNQPHPGGYLQIMLNKDKVTKNFLIHRLVAEAFIPNPNRLIEVNHKKGNKKDNRATELEWVSKEDNISHSFETGLATRGQDSLFSKLTENDVKDILKKYLLGWTQTRIAKDYPVNQQTISEIVRYNTWKHIRINNK